MLPVTRRAGPRRRRRLIGESIVRRDRATGWAWQVTNLDLNLHALRLNAKLGSVADSVLALPFRYGSFDVVIASQMTHHLISVPDIIQHFREAWRITKQALVLSDLHRNAGFHALVRLVVHALGLSPELRSDELLSVRHGIRFPKWEDLTRPAGISRARNWLHLSARIMLEARKPV